MISWAAEASQQKTTVTLSYILPGSQLHEISQNVELQSQDTWMGRRGVGRKVVYFFIEEHWKERDTGFCFLLWKLT